MTLDPEAASDSWEELKRSAQDPYKTKKILIKA